MANKVEFLDEESGEIKIEYSGSVFSIPLYFFLKSKKSSNPAVIAGLEEAMKIGGHALSLDTTSVLISEIEKNLEGRLSVIRQIFENRKNTLKQSSAVGTLAEKTFEQALSDFSKELGNEDIVRPTGLNSQDGKVRSKSDRKLGDIEILIGNSDLKIAVESKYTGDGPAMGDLSLKGTYKSLTIDDHAKGQVRGAQANRESHYAIFITKPGSAVSKTMSKTLVVDQNDLAIYVVADMETGDFEQLKIAYILARALTLSLAWPSVQQHHLRSVAALLVRSANKLKGYEAQLSEISKLGKSVKDTADSLISDYQEDKEAIKGILDYLDAVSISTNQEALNLKVLEIEKLTGEKLEIKEERKID